MRRTNSFQMFSSGLRNSLAKSRLICNLKELNEFVEYKHFKMETVHSATNVMRRGCHMATIDLKDAYHSVPVSVEHRKFLKIVWKGKLYRYTALPFKCLWGVYSTWICYNLVMLASAFVCLMFWLALAS